MGGHGRHWLGVGVCSAAVITTCSPRTLVRASFDVCIKRCIPINNTTFGRSDMCCVLFPLKLACQMHTLSSTHASRTCCASLLPNTAGCPTVGHKPAAAPRAVRLLGQQRGSGHRTQHRAHTRPPRTQQGGHASTGTSCCTHSTCHRSQPAPRTSPTAAAEHAAERSCRSRRSCGRRGRWWTTWCTDGHTRDSRHGHCGGTGQGRLLLLLWLWLWGFACLRLRRAAAAMCCSAARRRRAGGLYAGARGRGGGSDGREHAARRLLQATATTRRRGEGRGALGGGAGSRRRRRRTHRDGRHHLVTSHAAATAATTTTGAGGWRGR